MAHRTPVVLGALLAGVVALASTGGSVPAAGPPPRVVAAEAVAAEAVASSVHFAAAGDFAATSNTREVLSLMDGLQPDLALALGDLSYGTTGAEQAWCDLVTSEVGAGFPFELLAGNHESNGQNGNINDFSACLPNQLPGLVGTYGRQYYVDVPAGAPLVRFVMISPGIPFPDSIWSYAAGTPRYQWTEQAIDGARAAAIPWVVVGMHKPCLSVGSYGCEVGADVLDLVLRKKVDLVLHGHEHLYQRTAQLALGAGCTTLVPGTADTDCIVDADPQMVQGAGTVFATVGTGGVGLRPVTADDPEMPYFVSTSGSATPTWGLLDVRVGPDGLSARFERTPGGTHTDAFTIAPGTAEPNQPPTASFTTSCTDLTCALDASASTDADGSLTSWTWDFGDGTTGTGRTTEHRFPAAGTYTVGLRVTDDDGAPATTTRSVTVTAPTVTGLARDTFTRTVASGLGTAEVGGAWRTVGGTDLFSVGSGSARLSLARPGAGLDMSLPAVSSTATDLTYTVTTDKLAGGSGLYLSAVGRRVGTSDYRAKMGLRADGSVSLGLTALTSGTERALAPGAVLPGLTYTAGQLLHVRMQTVGVSPTTVRAKVWPAGGAEPGAWAVSRTDSTAGLQTAGSVGFNAYVSSAATNTPVTLRVDDVLAQQPTP